jgi:hypothetical protein
MRAENFLKLRCVAAKIKYHCAPRRREKLAPRLRKLDASAIGEEKSGGGTRGFLKPANTDLGLHYKKSRWHISRL